MCDIIIASHRYVVVDDGADVDYLFSFFFATAVLRLEYHRATVLWYDGVV